MTAITLNIYGGTQQITSVILVVERFLCERLLDNPQAAIILIDRELENVCRQLCATLRLPVDGYTPLTIQGHPARKYADRVIVVGADLDDIVLSAWLEEEALKKG